MRSGFVEHLVSEANFVILFGSAARDDDKASALDLLVSSKQRPGGIERLEDCLGKGESYTLRSKGWRREVQGEFLQSLVIKVWCPTAVA